MTAAIIAARRGLHRTGRHHPHLHRHRTGLRQHRRVRALETNADFHAAVARAIECRDTGILRDIANEMLDRSQTPTDRIASQYLLAAAHGVITETHIPQPAS